MKRDRNEESPAAEEPTGWAGKTRSALAEAGRKAERWFRARMKAAAAFFGASPERHEETLRALSDLPSSDEFEALTRSLPEGYAERFSSVPLDHPEYLVGREKEMAQMMEAFYRWKSGKPVSAAVVGPDGSGKSTLLNLFEEKIASENIPVDRRRIPDRLRTQKDLLRFFDDWFEIPDRSDSPQALIDRILNLPSRILMIESGHRLMLRTVGGWEGLELLCALMMATRAHWLWIVAFREHPWRRMDFHHRIARYFTHPIPTLFHREKEFKEAILKRHASCGHPLLYTDQSAENLDLKQVRLADPDKQQVQQTSLEERYFNALFGLSGGNLQSGLYFWLISLRYSAETKEIVVLPCIKLDYGFFKGLDRRYLFTLAELMGNGGLTPAEHGEIFHVDALESRLTLDYLRGINVVRMEEGGTASERYRINPILYRPINESLESMNLLY